MSDGFSSPGSPPPPPGHRPAGGQAPPGSPSPGFQQPPPGYQQPGYQQPGYQQPGSQQPPYGYQPPGHQQRYGPSGWSSGGPNFGGQREKRSQTGPGVLGLAAGLALILGCLLPWATGVGQSVTGWTDLDGDGNVEAATLTVAGAVLVVLGGLTIGIGKNLAVAIVGLVVAAIAALLSLSYYSDFDDITEFGGSVGIGLYLCIFGGATGVGAFIWLLAAKRHS